MTRAVTIQIGLLVAILIHNLAYPLSAQGGIWPALFYVFYGLMLVIPAYMSENNLLAKLLTFSGGAVILAGLINSYTPNSVSALMVFLSSITYLGLGVIFLAGYTFRAGKVTNDVLLSATSLYLLMGLAFAAIYAFIEWLTPGSFTLGSEAAVTWQDLLYFSYVTLTTLGYGDILPSGFYAQSFVTFQVVIGTLYTVILLSRLVGMYSSN